MAFLFFSGFVLKRDFVAACRVSAMTRLRQTVSVSAAGPCEALLTARDGRATACRREADGVLDVGGLVEDGSQQRRVAGRRAHDAVGGRLQRLRKRALRTPTPSRDIHQNTPGSPAAGSTHCHLHTTNLIKKKTPTATLLPGIFTTCERNATFGNR